MVINSRISRRTALEYLLAFLASAIGPRAFAREKPGFPSSVQSQGSSVAAVAAGATPAAFPPEPANFRSIYSNEQLRDRFYLFLQNIYHLYPENQFHQLILDLTSQYSTDQEIYQKLLERLPEITPLLSAVTYGLPALGKQKEEMTRQTVELLGPSRAVNGYIEIGTTGRYFNGIQSQVNIAGPIYVLNDLAPTYSLEDIFERGQLTPVGTYVPMGDYDPFVAQYIPPESVELVTNFR